MVRAVLSLVGSPAAIPDAPLTASVDSDWTVPVDPTHTRSHSRNDMYMINAVPVTETMTAHV